MQYPGASVAAMDIADLESHRAQVRSFGMLLKINADRACGWH
jgi:hypothetical protein